MYEKKNPATMKCDPERKKSYHEMNIVQNEPYWNVCQKIRHILKGYGVQYKIQL